MTGIMNVLRPQSTLDFFFELIVRPDHRTGLMGRHEIEDAKKRLLVFFTISPMCGVTALVPGIPHNSLPACCVVVRFDIV